MQPENTAPGADTGPSPRSIPAGTAGPPGTAGAPVPPPSDVSAVAESLEEAAAYIRAVLGNLPALAEGAARIALEQLARARQLAELGSTPQDLHRLPLKELGTLVQRRREAAGFSQPTLAKRAGLSLKTIKNLESASHKPSRDTIGRLLVIPELGLIASDLLWARPSNERPNSWLLPSYSRRRLFDEMTTLLNSPGGALEQTSLYLDDQSAQDFMTMSGSVAFQDAFRSMPLDKCAERIAGAMGGRGVDVIALGSGDGRTEIRLVEELCRRRGGTDLRLFLLDVSHTLLIEAYGHACDRLLKHGVDIETAHGDFHRMSRYPSLLPRPETRNRRRVYAMLGGTLANLDNEVTFIRDALTLLAPGDMVLLDCQLGYAPTDRPDEIRRLDPPLRHGPPDQHKQWFLGPVRRYCQDLKSCEVSVELNTYCAVPGSYELLTYANVERGNGQTQRYMLYRVRRYELAALQSCIEQMGFRLLEAYPYGPGSRATVMLLERTGERE